MSLLGLGAPQAWVRVCFPLPGFFFLFLFLFSQKRQKSLFGYAGSQLQHVGSSVAACGIWLPHQESDSGSLDGESGVPATGPPEKRPHPAAWLGWQPGRWSPGKPFWGLSLLPGPVLLQLCYHLGLVSTDGLVSADGLASADGSVQMAWPVQMGQCRWSGQRRWVSSDGLASIDGSVPMGQHRRSGQR